MAAHQAPQSLGFSRQEHWSGLPFPSPMRKSKKWKWSRSVVSDSSQPHGLQPTRLLHPWDFPGKSTGVGCHCLLRCNEYSGLISFKMDWFDFLAVQRTLKILLQHHSSKTSILQRSTFFIGQLSHPYMTTGKTIAVTRWTFVGKVLSLFFNMLSRLVIAYLPRSKHLLISWLQSPFAVISEPRKINSVTVSIVSPSVCHGTRCHDLSFMNAVF